MTKWLLFLCTFGLLFTQAKGRFDHKNLYSSIEQISSQPIPPSVSELLNQHFLFLGEGSQMYAFESDDGAYVLKLFKARHKRPTTLSRIMENIKKNAAEQQISHDKWDRKFQDATRRYSIALTHLKEETGLIYLHFEKTENPLLVTVVDKYLHEIDLSSLPFIVQKKAELAPSYFKRLEKEGNPQKLQEAKEALREFFVTRTKKGFSDPRQSLSVNYGFIGDQPVQIDVGKIEPFDGDVQAEVKSIHERLDEWFSNISAL